MKRFFPGLAMSLLVLLCAGPAVAAGVDAAISGTVRDAHGTPQMGALLELLGPDASPIASALSDDHGRYIMPTVAPGRYVLRATAAFFLPAMRANVRLQAGAQSIVNVTMSTIFDAASWLPAQRRRADEPSDDWKWALRSTASRPLLRLLDPPAGKESSSDLGYGAGAGVSSSADQHSPMVSEGRFSILSGDGSFGGGGTHQTLRLARSLEDGDTAMMTAVVGTPQAAEGVQPTGPSVAVTAGYERRSPFGGSTRLVSSYQSHPELVSGATLAQGASTPNGGQGFQVLQLASTEQMALGDAVLIDAGTLMQAERLAATRIESEPYLRISVRPSGDLVVEYRLATGRTLQSAEDLDHLRPVANVVADAAGRPLSDKGLHQEISLSRRLNGSTVLSAAVFQDRVDSSEVAGGGLHGAAEVAEVAIADPTTGMFCAAAPGYSSRGMSVSVMQPLTAALSAWAEWDLGTALQAQASGLAVADALAGAQSGTAQAASLALRGRILRTGSSLRAEYRWQPTHTLTQVNAYNTTPEEAYLSFYLRQRLWAGRLLPRGVDAVIEATNLLEQGYQPVLAPDGHTLFLAQVPRALQAGLAFNF